MGSSERGSPIRITILNDPMIRRKITIVFIAVAAALITTFLLFSNYVPITDGLKAIVNDVSSRESAFILLSLAVPPVSIAFFCFESQNLLRGNIFALLYIAIIFSATITAIILTYRRFKPLDAKYDRKYLLDILSTSGKDGRLYTTSKEDLARKILGDKPEQGELDDIYSAINAQIKPIKDFLEDKPQDSSTLIVNSKWGTGKTTSVLIAINEIQNIEHDDKFLYESVFRYSASMDEFVNDFLGTFSKVLYLLGLDTDKDIDALAKNYSVSPSETISNLLKSQDIKTNFSIEIMARINNQYKDNKCKKLIFVIIDDLDRLQGKEIIRVLSLLSLLRHLSFVRIIIPVDTSMVARILGASKIPDPERYIEKYLPEQTSVLIDFGYATAESVILTMIENGGTGADDVGCAIWAAILVNMLADILRKETNALADHRGDWLIEMYKGNPNDVGWVAYRILKSAPDFMKSRANGNLSCAKNKKIKYYWDPEYNSIQNFENIIHALRFSKDETAVRNKFSQEEYETLIVPWIFEYAEKHWSEFGFTMRKVLDGFSKLKPVLDKMPKTAEGAFAFSYNQFFPNKKITLKNNKHDK